MFVLDLIFMEIFIFCGFLSTIFLLSQSKSKKSQFSKLRAYHLYRSPSISFRIHFNKQFIFEKEKQENEGEKTCDFILNE